MTRVWFIADTHIRHKRVIQHRPEFSTMEEHDETILANLCAMVGKRDTLFILGDSALSLEGHVLLSKVPGYKRLILGNHCVERDGCRVSNIHHLYDRIDGDVSYSQRESLKYWLSHVPIHPEELRGKINIHGHGHRHIIQDERYISVSAENTDYKPVSFEEIRDGTYVTFNRASTRSYTANGV